MAKVINNIVNTNSPCQQQKNKQDCIIFKWNFASFTDFTFTVFWTYTFTIIRITESIILTYYSTEIWAYSIIVNRNDATSITTKD